MSGSKEKHLVTLDEGFEGEVIRGGIRIEFNANGGVDVYAPVPVTFHPAADLGAGPDPINKALLCLQSRIKAFEAGAAPRQNSAAGSQPKIGDLMPAGTEYAGMKYAGISPDTGKPFYVDAVDAPGTYTFNEAQEYAASHGKRLPSKEELNVLFNNRAAIGAFNQTGSDDPAGWYWSSSRIDFISAWAQRFSDGHQDNFDRYGASSLRCVR